MEMTLISEKIQAGRAKEVKVLVQQALDEGIDPNRILNEGLMAGMAVIGERFKNGEAFVPEVLVAARAMNKGAEILKPHLAAEGTKATEAFCKEVGADYFTSDAARCAALAAEICQAASGFQENNFKEISK